MFLEMFINRKFSAFTIMCFVLINVILNKTVLIIILITEGLIKTTLQPKSSQATLVNWQIKAAQN